MCKAVHNAMSPRAWSICFTMEGGEEKGVVRCHPESEQVRQSRFFVEGDGGMKWWWMQREVCATVRNAMSPPAWSICFTMECGEGCKVRQGSCALP